MDARAWSMAAMISFGLGVVSFVSALCCFMIETMIATQLLNFHPLRKAAMEQRPSQMNCDTL